MNKLFTKIAALALGMTMATGVGVAVASSSEAKSASATVGDELAICQGTGSGYGTRRTLTDSHNVGWVLATGQSGYLGANNASNHGKVKPTAADLPVVKGVLSTATTDTTGYYFYYTTSAVSNVGSIEFSYTANSGNTSATGYVLSSSTAAASGSATWTQISLTTGSQNVSLSSSGTFTFGFSTETSAKYYGFIIKTSSYKRLTAGTIKLLEGASSSVDVEDLVVFDEEANELSDGDEINVSASGESATSEITCEVSYSDETTDGNVTIISEPSAGFSVDTEDDSTYTMTFTANGDYDVTISATADDNFSITVTYHVSGIAVIVYEKVTDVTALKAGKEILIGTSTGSQVMGTWTSGTYIPSLNSTPDASGNLPRGSLPTGYMILTLGGNGTSGWTFQNSSNLYLNRTGDKNVQFQNSSTSTWTISITAAGVATITTGGQSMKYNSSSPRFTVYSSGQTSVSIYMIPSGSSPLDSIALSGTYPTVFGQGAEFSHEGMTVTATYEDESTADVSAYATFSGYDMSTAGVQTVTVSYTENNVTKTTTYSITIKDVVISTNTIKENGTAVPATVTKDGYYTDDTFTFTATIVYVSGEAYEPGSGEVTWASSSTGVATITSGGVVSPVANGSTTISATPKDGSNAGQKIASFTLVISNLKERIYIEISDEITLTDTGVSGSGYASWSNLSKKSNAVYAGNNAGGNNALQYNNASSSGLYTSASGGKLYSVSVVWNSNTASSNTRKLYIYGTNTLPTAISDAESATKLGEVNYISGTTNVTDDDFEYQYLIITGCGNAVYVDKITVTWKAPGAEHPLESDPVLSLDKDEIYVGKTATLTIVTDPVDSDEVLNVSSSDESIATVSGSDRTYTIHGVSAGTATITVSGSQIPEGESEPYSSTIDIDVDTAVQLPTDKVLTYAELGLDAGSYASNDGDHFYEAIDYTTYNVIRNGSSFQFRNGNPSPGYIYNKDAYSWNIKSITLIGASTNVNDFMVYEGTSSQPSNEVAVSGGTFDQTGVNTYVFSSGMTYFKIGTTTGTGNHHLDYIVIELVDSASSDLTKARQAAAEILDAFDGLCGTGGSGVVSPSEWSALNNTLSTLLSSASGAKTILHDAVRLPINDLGQGSATIENAMYHYDYCVTKFGYTPYSGITPAQSNTRVTPLNIITNNSNTVAIIVIISVISVSAVGGYFFLRKRKEN